MYHSSAPGKVILSGEHSVVYGHPCLVTAISLRSLASVEVIPEGIIEIISDKLGSQIFNTVEGPSDEGQGLAPIASVARSALEGADAKNGLRIRIESEIPLGAGLGSSASVLVAVASACSNALSLKLTPGDIAELASVGERRAHLKPSGVDVNIALRGGAILFRRGGPLERAEYPKGMKLVLGSSGSPRRTADMVKRVADLAESSRDLFSLSMRAISGITTRMSAALAESDMASVGSLMLLNHLALSLLGVSSESLDKLVNSAISGNALGAKLTGAGGGGCIVAITPPGDEQDVSQWIEGAGGVPFVVSVSAEGMRSWSD